MAAWRVVLICLALAATTFAPPARAQSSATVLQASAQNIVGSMHSVLGGPPIAILTRNDTDLSGFYYTAMQTLCATAPDYNWCDSDLTSSLTDTTNLMGWARLLNYTSTTTQASASVCVILPPSPSISATSIASGLGNGAVYDWRDLPTQDEALAWLWLHYGAICQGTDGGTADQKAADAYASLMLTLVEGSTAFVGAQDVSPSRKFSFYDGYASTAWATNVGERILLELWKGQAAAVLKAGGCNASAAPSGDLNTPAIQRITFLPPGGDCNPDQNGNRNGSVSDANLWLWTANGGAFAASWPTVPLPPKTYVPFMNFKSVSDGILYGWTTAKSIASQY